MVLYFPLFLAWFGLVLVLVQILKVPAETIPMIPQTPQVDLKRQKNKRDGQKDTQTLVFHK